jgi:hypothetical protein
MTRTSGLPPTGIAHRFAGGSPSTYDKASHSCDAVLSAGAEVARFYGREILRIDSKSIDLSRVLSGGVPLLDSHSQSSIDSVLGRIDQCWIAGGKLHGKIVFAQTPAVRQAEGMVSRGELKALSVGYSVSAWEITGEDGNVIDPEKEWLRWDDTDLTFTAVRWQLLEASLVGVPADSASAVRSFGGAASGDLVDVRARNVGPPAHARTATGCSAYRRSTRCQLMAARFTFKGFSMNKVLIDVESRIALPSMRVDPAGTCQQGVGSSSILNPGAVGLSVPPASDSIGPVCTRHVSGAGRSAEDNFRISIHEAAHVIAHRVYGHEICGVSIIPDGESLGRTWGPQAVHAAAIWNADSLSGLDVSPDGDVDGLFSRVQAGIVCLMAGCASEMTFCGGPPRYIGADVPDANMLAGFVCRTTASIAALVEHGYQESLAIIEQHRTVVIAIAQALIDKRTLDGAEIDAVIAPALAAKAAADEHTRRADWNAVLDNAAAFTADLES